MGRPGRRRGDLAATGPAIVNRARHWPRAAVAGTVARARAYRPRATVTACTVTAAAAADCDWSGAAAAHGPLGLLTWPGRQWRARPSRLRAQV